MPFLEFNMKKIIAFFTACVLLIAPLAAYAETTLSPEKEAMNGILEWQSENVGSVSLHVGENACDWLAFSAGRSGKPDESYAKAALVYYSSNSDRLTVPDLERLSLAVSANGGDIVGSGMLKALTDNFTNGELSEKLINQLIFALIVLDSGLYELPEGADLSRQALVDEILSRQLDSGALWMMNETVPETDVTAMAVTALSPYVTGSGEVRAAVSRMTDFLSANVTDDATVKNWGAPSCETTAQTIVALCSLGIDPTADERFVKNGKTLLDGLLSYRRDDGGFAHNESGSGSDAYATAQSFYALSAYLRCKTGSRALYDLRSEHSDEFFTEVTSLSIGIYSLDTSDEAAAKRILDKYAAFAPGDRRYISGFEKLYSAFPEGFDGTFFSPDEIASNEGAALGDDLFEPIGASSQSLTAADENVSRLEASSQTSSQGGRGIGVRETAFLISVAVVAAAVIVLNHTVMKRTKNRK